MPLSVHVEFGGGAELLFEKVKHHDLTLPDQPDPWSLRNLIAWIRDNLLKVRALPRDHVYTRLVSLQERVDLFVMGETVRPGILVLVNSTDWELLGQLDYVLQQNDHVVFISTLHGG